MNEKNDEQIRATEEKNRLIAVALSNDLAENPEIAFEEFESSKKMVTILKAAGFEVEYPFAGYETAFCATLKNAEGPNVAILVEYDALPMLGHACGHNFSGSLSILSALSLQDLKSSFQGTLYVIGTPAEEDDGAKIKMSSDGIFDQMDLAILFHGQGGGKSQANMDALSLRCYIFDFIGQASHAAAAPQEGKNALIAAVNFINLLNNRRQGFTFDMRFNCIITDGGVSTNVIPEKSTVRIEFRTGSMSALEKMDQMILSCANGAALASDCKVSWRKAISDFADMVCLPTLVSEMEKILEEVGEKVIPVGPAIASTDMGNVSYRCPALQPLIAITDQDYALHTPEFETSTKTQYAYDAMARGSQAMIKMVLKIFNDQEFRQAVQEDFHKQLKRKTGT